VYTIPVGLNLGKLLVEGVRGAPSDLALLGVSGDTRVFLGFQGGR
jgi:hypothetical protein